MLTPVKAIRAKCLDCCSDQPSEVRLCPSEDCALWPYRMGHNPARSGIGGKISSSYTESVSIGEKVAEEICEKKTYAKGKPIGNTSLFAFHPDSGHEIVCQSFPFDPTQAEEV